VERADAAVLNHSRFLVLKTVFEQHLSHVRGIVVLDTVVEITTEAGYHGYRGAIRRHPRVEKVCSLSHPIQACGSRFNPPIFRRRRLKSIFPRLRLKAFVPRLGSQLPPALQSSAPTSRHNRRRHCHRHKPAATRFPALQSRAVPLLP